MEAEKTKANMIKHKAYIIAFIVFFKTIFDYLYEKFELNWIIQEVIYFSSEYMAWILVCMVFISVSRNQIRPKELRENEIILFKSIIGYFLVNIFVLLIGLKYVQFGGRSSSNYNEFREFTNGFDKNLIAWGVLILSLAIGKFIESCQKVKLSNLLQSE